MDYLNRLKATVSSVASQVNAALPGNPVTREYELLGQIATAGPGLNWKIYAGRKYTTKQSVAVWLFDKKDIERWSRNDREQFAEVLKRGVAQLTRLRHPRLLVVEHPLEESRDSFAFCTEPLFASLANCLGRIDNMPAILPAHLADFALLDIEIRHGLVQLAEALAFLHVDARILHRNVCPESIVVNDRGAWKLGGFEFCTQGVTPPGSQIVQFDMFDWDQRVSSILQPQLDYLAPEYVLGGRCDMHADMFSLGVLAFALFNKAQTPFNHKNNVDTWRRNAEQLKTMAMSALNNVPSELRDDLKMCLNFTPDLRPDAMQFSKVVYFEDALVKTLNYLESLCQMDNSTKSQFFKNLPSILGKFPKRPLLQKVLPCLAGEFTTPDLIPFILPSIFHIAEEASESEFAAVIFPHLIPVFAMERPYQIALILLQRMELLLQKTPEEEVKKHVLPLIYNSLGSETTKIQELCLTVIPTVGRLVDRDSMKTQLLPKLLRLTTDASVLAVRVQALLCIGKLLPTLEPWMVCDQILPTLPRINSKEPGVLMAILGIYKMAYETERFGISREQCARSVLPFVIATSVENTLNLSQFEQYMTFARIVLDRVESEQRMRLQQLSAAQEEQRSMPDFNQVIGQVESKKVVSKALDGLVELGGTANGGAMQGTPGTAKKTGPLSLEEKKRLAAEQEQSLRMRSQPSLLPREQSPLDTASTLTPAVITAMPGKTNTPIDLTAFLPSSTSTMPAIQPQIPVFMPQASGGLTFPESGAFAATSSLTGIAQLGGNFNLPTAGPTPPVLPLPPSTSNPVLRPGIASSSWRPQMNNPVKTSMSAFDDLLVMPSRAGGSTASTVVRPPKKDPFSDLLG